MLNERQKAVLFQVIRIFVSSGEPVSSAAVARSGALEVSSATIRNVMSRLEAQGLLLQPHTSAGRVPTPIGLRLYVDALLLDDAPASQDPFTDQLHDQVARLEGEDVESTARAVGGLLSELVHLTSIISLPRLGGVRLQDIHLSPLSERRLLAVLVTSDERVYHRVVQLEQQLDGAQLRRIQAYLSELTLGLTLEQVRARVHLEMQALEREWNETVRCALEIGRQALEVAQPKVLVEGKLNLFDYSEWTSDVQQLRHLLEILEEKERVLELLDGLLEERRPTVLIGPELDLDLGDDVSLVVCGYHRDEEPLGLLGLIGPARIDYARIVPLVAYTARVLSAQLASKS